MSRIYGKVKAGDLRGYIVRHSGSGVGTIGDAWRRFLMANSGTGKTFYSLEKSWMKAQGYTTYGQLCSAAGINGKNEDDSITRFVRT